MAKSTRTSGNVKPIRQEDGPEDTPNEAATAVADPEPATSEPPTPFDPPTAEPVPPKKKTPRTITFFDRVQNIEKADWGTRAKIKLYRLAPIINRLVGSENKYVTIYFEPVNEEKIKLDHGSGRYRLYLNLKTAGDKEEKELDMIEFDILDPAFPPKIPPGEWVDDPRNRQWQWARPAGAAPANGTPAPAPAVNPIGEFVDMLRATNEMRKEMREEVQAAAPPTPPPVAAAPVAADPFDTVAKIMGMRSNDPMITLLLSRMDAQDKAMEASRQREYDLQQKLLDAKTNAPSAAPAKGLVEQLTELASISDKLAPLKTLFGFGSAPAAAAEAVRHGKFGWLDFAREVIPDVVNSDILKALAMKIAASTQQQQAPGAPLPIITTATPARPNIPANPSIQETLQFVQSTVTPALCEYFQTGNDGATFAEWLEDGFVGSVARLQEFGEAAMFNLYKLNAPPDVKAIVFARGDQPFQQFIKEFCGWKPEGEAEVKKDESGIIDLDSEDVEDNTV